MSTPMLSEAERQELVCLVKDMPGSYLADEASAILDDELFEEPYFVR